MPLDNQPASPVQMLHDALVEATKGQGGLSCRIHEGQISELMRQLAQLQSSHAAVWAAWERESGKHDERERDCREKIEAAQAQVRIERDQAWANKHDADAWRSQQRSAKDLRAQLTELDEEAADERGGTVSDFGLADRLARRREELSALAEHLIVMGAATADEIRALVEQGIKDGLASRARAVRRREEELRQALCAPAPKSCLEVIAEQERADAAKAAPGTVFAS